MHHRRFDPARSHKLEDPERKRLMPIPDVLALLQLTAGMQVADLGAGTGYFAVPIATAIPSGIVHAIDISPEMLDKLRQKLAAPGSPGNIQLLQSPIDQIALPSGSVDAALCANVWHELDDRMAALKEVARILKPKGRFVILDWRNDIERGEMGPPIEERLAVKDVQAEMRKAGWLEIATGTLGAASFCVTAVRT